MGDKNVGLSAHARHQMHERIPVKLDDQLRAVLGVKAG